jgi:hypothetical protein
MKKKEEMKWTQFWDMHSGGGQKEKFSQCFIEAPEKEAKVIFYNRFGHSPERVSCTCCGEDYSVSESETLEQATAYQRGCAYGYFKGKKRIPDSEGFVSGKGSPKGVKGMYIEEADSKYSKEYIPLEKYIQKDDVCVIYAKDIKPTEKVGEVPEQGYVRMD